MIPLPPGHRLLHLPSVDSTNAEALRRARAGEPEGLVVWADEQVAGRGRQGRRWLGGGDSVAFSLLRRPGVPPQEATRWTLLAGLAVVDALQAAAPELWLKWPNDVLLGRRKAGGILCELDGGAIVVGIGLNLAPPAGGWPQDLVDRAASLPPGVGGREQVIAGVLASFDRLETELLQQGPAPLMARYRRALAPMIGWSVRVDGGAEPWAARVEGVDDSGALVVLDGSGARRTVLAGDVHLLGPAIPEAP